MTVIQPSLRREPLRYRLRAFFAKPANMILLFFLAALIILSLLPMITMLTNMFTVHAGTEKKMLRVKTGSWTLSHFQMLFADAEWSRANFWTPLFNSLISMVKNTSLAANITVLEMFMATQRIVGRTYRAMPLYLEVAFIYLIFSTALSWLQRYCEKRLNHYGGV